MKEIIAVLIVVILVFGWLLYDTARGTETMCNKGIIDSVRVEEPPRMGQAPSREYIPYSPIYKKRTCTECNRVRCDMCEKGGKKEQGDCAMCGKGDSLCGYCNI